LTWEIGAAKNAGKGKRGQQNAGVENAGKVTFV